MIDGVSNDVPQLAQRMPGLVRALHDLQIGIIVTSLAVAVAYPSRHELRSWVNHSCGSDFDAPALGAFSGSSFERSEQLIQSPNEID